MSARKTSAVIVKCLVLLCAMGYLIFAIAKMVRPKGELVCEGIDLVSVGDTARQLIDHEGIRQLLLRHKVTPEGMAFAQIDLQRIDSILEASPYIDSVLVYPTSSERLCIKVRMAQPIVDIFPQQGSECYMTADGRLLPAGGLNANILVATGCIGRTFAKGPLLRLCQAIEADDYWRLQVQQINVTPKEELQLITRVGEQVVELGDTADLADKLQRVRLFYEKAMPKAGWTRYQTINARHPGQITCVRK